MKAWSDACNNNNNEIVFLADWDASFVKEINLDIDLTAANLGHRAKR